MFKTTRALFSGLVWKQTKWNKLRKGNAQKQRKRVDSVIEELRKPYTTAADAAAPQNTVAPQSQTAAEASKKLNFQTIMQRLQLNAYQAKRTDIVNQAFNARKQ